MFLIVILAFAVSTVFSSEFSCKDGVEINTELITNPDDMVGNWSHPYHWGGAHKKSEFLDSVPDHNMSCPIMEILKVTSDFVQSKKEKCKDPMPFKWEDAKLIMKASFMGIEDSIIFFGKNENWLFVDCEQVVRIELKKVEDDVIVMTNPDAGNISQLMSRRRFQMGEFKCIIQNIDIGKGLHGVGHCNY